MSKPKHCFRPPSRDGIKAPHGIAFESHTLSELCWHVLSERQNQWGTRSNSLHLIRYRQRYAVEAQVSFGYAFDFAGAIWTVILFLKIVPHTTPPHSAHSRDQWFAQWITPPPVGSWIREWITEAVPLRQADQPG